MTESTQNELPLFDPSLLPVVNATGDPLAVNDDDPATVPVPLQVVINKIEGRYTARDRKLWTLMLACAHDEITSKTIHVIKIADIERSFREMGGEHGRQWILDSIRRQARTSIEYTFTLGDPRFIADEKHEVTIRGQTITVQEGDEFFTTMLEAKVGRDEVHYSYPAFLLPILQRPLRFARLRIPFLIGLSGKYAVTLYEILEGYANRRDGQCRVTIEDLRVWLKVPEGSYKDWRDFKRWVLKPALKQINNDPEGAGFSVSYTPIRKGRKIGEIVFKLNKTKGRKLLDASAKKSADRKKAKADKGSLSIAKLDSLLSDKVQDEARSIARQKRRDIYQLKKEFVDWCDFKNTKNLNGAFLAFVKKKKEL